VGRHFEIERASQVYIHHQYDDLPIDVHVNESAGGLKAVT